MADETQTRPADSPSRSSAVPRDKPLIEGRAEEIADETPASPGAEPSGTQEEALEDAWASLPGPATAEVMPHTEPAPDLPRQSASRGDRPVALWPFAAAIVAAVLAGGGVFGLHLADKAAARMAALESRVDALERRPNPAQAVEAAQKNLASQVGALAAAAADAKAGIAALHAQVAELAAVKPPAAAPDLAPVETRLNGLEEKLAALDTKVNGLAATFNAEKGQVRAETRASQSAATSADDEATAILAANLLRRIESGAPYETNITALAKRGFDHVKLAPLEPAAASGVATPAVLAGQFSALTPAILATAPQPKEKGFLDHLVQGAERLVRVEKIGDTSGNDLAAGVARVQAALDAGDVEAAYQKWNALPQDARAKSKAFATAAKARLDAIAAARAIDADAIAALGKAKPRGSQASPDAQ